jgi:hypothetical protein
MNEGITYGISQEICMLHQDFQDFANISSTNSSETNVQLKNMNELLFKLLEFTTQKRDRSPAKKQQVQCSPSISNSSRSSGRSNESNPSGSNSGRSNYDSSRSDNSVRQSSSN